MPEAGIYARTGRKMLFLVAVACLIIGSSSQTTPINSNEQPKEAYFNGTTSLKLGSTVSVHHHSGLSFRTCDGGRLFTQTYNDDEINLDVTSEGLVFTAKIKNEQYRDQLSARLLDNQWHNINLVFLFGNFNLTAARRTQIIANATYNSKILTLSTTNVSTTLIVGKGFKGCILQGPKILFNDTVNYGAVLGKCPSEVGKCGLNSIGSSSTSIDQTKDPCRNGSRQDNYDCLCNPGYDKNCNVENGSPLNNQLCKDNLCKNNGKCQETTNGYICECEPGWTGKNCEEDINECAESPCKNEGVCHNGFNNYTCICDSTGYTGRNCEINIDECVKSPCQTGNCHDHYGGYTCECPQGSYGHNCEYYMDQCSSKPCKNGGTCSNNSGTYRCTCPPGFYGKQCECPPNSMLSTDNYSNHTNYPPNCISNHCESNPCANGGTCISDNVGYNCSCTSEWKGSHCHIPISDWCSVCYNGGTCIETIYGVMCQCPRFWTGPQCKEPVTCRDFPCRQATSCHDYPGGYYCSCEPGWTGPECSIDIDECSNNPCRNGGICIDQTNTYYCKCLLGYTGKQCHINNKCHSQPCKNGGTCISDRNSYTCNCTQDYMGPNCELEYDACVSKKPCLNNGTCVLIPRSKHDFICECSAGFEGKVCEDDVDDCIGVICPDDRVCVDKINGSECKCRPGYREPNCTLIVDHCAKNPCNNGTCIDLGEKGFHCACNPGFTGPDCDIDINECIVLGNSSCNNGICFNTIGSYNCYCRPGFSGDHCSVDIDECLCGPCKNNATCIDKINAYECRCQPGYGGENCGTDINECDSNPCQNNATCVNEIAAYSCICTPGFTGRNCEINIDDCESLPCSHGGLCIDGINNYTCDCTNTGYEGFDCEINIDECLSNPCQNDALCFDEIKTYKCRCYPGYTGLNCEIDIDECESSPCQNNGTCLERSNKEMYKSTARNLPAIFTQEFSYKNASGYECICDQGLTGKNCEQNINECESNPCLAGICKDRIGGYTCECDDGFEGDHCQHDIDECLRYQPCQHGTCIDGRADYFCTCKPDYGGKNCSVALIGCQGNACKNGGTCLPYLFNETEHRFNCTCPNGFHGDICDNITTMSLSGSSYVMVNTRRDEGYDIQFRFRTTLPNGLLAMGKGVTYYILELVDGKLNLHSSILNKWEGVFIGSGLNNSKWQKVFVAINATHLVLSANEEQTIYPINLNDGSNTSTTFPTTYVGGTISYLRKLSHGPPFFVGCTEDVGINGEWIYPGMQSDAVSMEYVEPFCPREEQCSPNPCKAGGHCTDRWRDFSCKCERPYLGHRCQYNMTAATFRHEKITDSYVTIKVSDTARRAVRSIVDISMFIRTREERGDIFYLGADTNPNSKSLENTYIAAQLVGGELLVRMQFNETEAYTVGGVKLNDGNNHLIQVIRNMTLVQVKINGTEYFRKTISAAGQSNVTVLYLGGLPRARYTRQVDSRQMEYQVMSQVNFKGIIQDVQISNGSETMVVEFYPLKANDIPSLIQFGNVTFDSTKVLPGVVSDNVCEDNPCNHNGDCHVTWNDFWCECPRGYTGKTCQEMEFCQLRDCPSGSKCQNLDGGYECIANATFDGVSTSFTYIYDQSKATNTSGLNINTIEIAYRSNSGGTLMHMASNSDDQHFTISVYKDVVTVAWKLSMQNQDTISFGKEHPDGNWTSILLKLNSNSLICSHVPLFDETSTHSSSKFNFTSWYELLKSGTVTLGGLADYTWSDRTGYMTIGNDRGIDGNSVDLNDRRLTTSMPPYEMMSGESFKGCLGEVRIGSMLLHYFTFDEIYRNANFTPVEFLALQTNTTRNENIGCRLCLENDCKNNGHCHNPLNSYICDCPPGYTEDYCSVNIDECVVNDCQNNSTCIDGIANYTCECLNGWHGWHCEVFKLITCNDQPCANGSTCTDDVNPKNGDNFTCTCMSGYEGVRCNVPYCIARNCKNGGRCDFQYQAPQCTCLAGFSGDYCENNDDDCKIIDGVYPCKNEGKCIDGINAFKCDCNGTGYTGPDCSIDIDECALVTTDCGFGQCENLNGTYHCLCEEDYCSHNCRLLNPCVEGICANGGTCDCNEENGYICYCAPGFTGPNCTDSAPFLGSQAMDIAIIVGPIVGILLLTALGSLTALFMMARKKRATRGTYSPSAQEFSNPRVEMDNVMKPPPEERLI